MKKLLTLIAIALCLFAALSACTSTQSVDDVIASMEKEVTITDVTTKAADMIGAKEGKSFEVDGNVFEIYKFDDSEKLDEAKTGTMIFDMDGFGEFSVTCITEGDFVLVYTEKDATVESAFKKAVK